MSLGKTILLVEDEPSNAEVLAFFLELKGYRVVVRGDGRAAWETLDEVAPDLVLTDVMMPYMDGRELCRHIREHPRFRDVPILLLTAISAVDLQDGCRVEGVVGKPVDLDRLAALLDGLIGAPQQA